MKKKLVLIFVLIVIAVGFLNGCTETSNNIPTEESRFIGTWKSEENPLIIPVTLILYSEGTSLMGGLNSTWELKEGQLVITLTDNELVSSFDYYFTEDDTVLHLQLFGNDVYDIYLKQI
jgi:hypothetical protein